MNRSDCGLAKSGAIELINEPQKRNPRIYVDDDTGLMWTVRDNGARLTWAQANEYAQQLRLGGYADWRLPTIDELEDMHEAQGVIRKPFTVHALMWSSTTSGPNDALFYNFWMGVSGTLP